MSYIKIMVHVVWGTKDRVPILNAEIRERLLQHICENAREKGIYIDVIGGYLDHVHVLISLGGGQSIANVVQLLKGESAFWANKMSLVKSKLVWASDYFAASVSESSVERVRTYIRHQEEHHRELSFAEEYERFLKSYGFDKA